MKRFLCVLAIAASLAACNDRSAKSSGAEDFLDSATDQRQEALDSYNKAQEAIMDSNSSTRTNSVDSLPITDTTHK